MQYSTGRVLEIDDQVAGEKSVAANGKGATSQVSRQSLISPSAVVYIPDSSFHDLKVWFLID
jgi:hypothetical protein